MSMRKHGNLSYEIQPGSEVIYRHDGLIEGQLVLIGDRNSLNAMLSLLGGAHPSDSRARLHAYRRENLKLNRVQVTYDAIGVFRSPTDRIVQMMPAVRTDPIETHPDFVARLAGTESSPLNGATFDPETGAFTGFAGGEDLAAQRKAGLESYYTGSVIVRATHYSTVPPRMTQAFKISNTLPNIPEVAGVKDWLYMPPSANQVVHLWQVTEEWQGSDARGWDPDVYGN